MFIILLKFSDNKGRANQYMDGHKAWIKSGFEDDVFLVVGNLQPKLGGAIMAHNSTLLDMQNRVSADPFVAQNIVSAEIIEIMPAKTDERLKFLVVE